MSGIALQQKPDGQKWLAKFAALREAEHKARIGIARLVAIVFLIPISTKLCRILELPAEVQIVSYMAILGAAIYVMRSIVKLEFAQEKNLLDSKFQEIKPDVSNALRVQIKLKQFGMVTGSDLGWLWIDGTYLHFRGLRGEVKIPASPKNRVIKEKDEGFPVITSSFVLRVDYPFLSENIIPGTKFFEQVNDWESQCVENEEENVYPQDVQAEYWYEGAQQWRTVKHYLWGAAAFLLFTTVMYFDERIKRPDSVMDYLRYSAAAIIVIAMIGLFQLLRQRRTLLKMQAYGLKRGS